MVPFAEASRRAPARQVRRDGVGRRRRELADVVQHRGPEVGHRQAELRERVPTRAGCDRRSPVRTSCGPTSPLPPCPPRSRRSRPSGRCRTGRSSGPTRDRARASSRHRSRTSPARPCPPVAGAASSRSAASSSRRSTCVSSSRRPLAHGGRSDYAGLRERGATDVAARPRADTGRGAARCGRANVVGLDAALGPGHAPLEQSLHLRRRRRLRHRGVVEDDCGNIGGSASRSTFPGRCLDDLRGQPLEGRLPR